MELNDYMRGNGGVEPFGYYIIQRKGSSEIIDLVKFANYEEAARAARLTLPTGSNQQSSGVCVRDNETELLAASATFASC